jgi:hypothetical protein
MRIELSKNPPTSLFSGILTPLGMTELAIFLFPFFFKDGVSATASYRELEKEIGTFITHKFN